MEPAGKMSKTASPKKSYKVGSKSDSVLVSSTEKSSKTSCESTITRVFQTELAKFCPRKLFYIFLVAENDEKSALLLDNLVETGKDYEEISSLTFISREDVLALMDTSSKYIFPNQLKPLLLNVIECIENQSEENIPLNLETQLIKLKVIQVMYRQYADHVKRNEKQRDLETLLNALSKECKKKQKKDDHAKGEDENKNKSPRKEDVKSPKKNKKEDKAEKDANKDEEIDYTTFPLEKDGISYEENIFDYISFYCIKGYYNADLVQSLIDQVNVPISGVIKVSESDINELNQSELESFWEHIKKYFFKNTTQYKSLENTVIMEFTPTKTDPNEGTVAALEEFVYMLRKIVNIKLSYLNYLRHLRVNKIQHSYMAMRVECLQQYHKSLRYMPLECIHSNLILDSVLKEVCFNVQSNKVSKSSSLRSLFLAKSSTKSVHCIDPLQDFDAFAMNVKKNSSNLHNNFNSNVKTFLVHENDTLTKILKSYQYVGPKIANIRLNLMKFVPGLPGLDHSDSVADDIIHLHDRDPSKELDVENSDVLDYFLYMFLFNTFSSRIDPPRSTVHYDLLNNLTTFSLAKFWNEVQPRFEGETIDTDENLYDTSIINFRCKERLSKNMLIQEMFEASNEFLYVNQKYSPETDSFLVVFSDKLDNFGVNTKTFDVVIRTPICLRDFCRYTMVEEADWLRENKTKIDEETFKISFDENCPGAQKVKTELKLFQEYSYLLDGNLKEECEDDMAQPNDETEETVGQDSGQGIDFLDIVTDLEKCPSGSSIIQECENAIEDKQILSYDMGTNLFKVTGKRITFCSHDNVKVTVDNTGFLQYPEKCTFNLSSNGNVLTLHSRESLLTRPYITTLQLKDDSRISFIISSIKAEPERSAQESQSAGQENEEEIDNVIYGSSEVSKMEENPSEEEKEPETKESDVKVEQVVHCVDEDYIKGVLAGKSLDDLSTNENCDDLIESLLIAKENNGTIYKVNTKSSYLKRRNNTLKIPLENAFRNILSFDNLLRKETKPYQTYTQRFEPEQDNKSALDVKGPVDVRICLPNGLYIRAHSCVVDTTTLMIKQEYIQEKPDVPTVQHEEFRLFSSQGFVLIKKIDGTLTLLKANGDIINFEKPNDGSGENNTVRSCHCSTLDDYRNKLNKLLKDQETCDFTTSRRGHITSKQNHIVDRKILKVLEQFDVPYLKKSILKFDGKRVKIVGDKITQKQSYHIISQQDFCSGDIFFERNDDFRSTFDKTGFQKIFFPDGTIISNSMEIADDLVDDFVFVKLAYRYEHPYYATVKFNVDKTSEIVLNSDVVLKENSSRLGFKVNMEKGLSLSISNENIFVEKTCEKCSGQFQASFDIKPFIDGIWNPSEEFMHVSDSYKKQFNSDFVGNCSRNNDYMKGTTNLMRCNHVAKTNYKKLFVINKDFTGDIFHTIDEVKTKTKEMETLPHASVDTYKMVSNENITVVDCRQKFFAGYAERFYNNCKDHLPNYFKKSTNTQSELYTTFKLFHKIFHSVDEIARHISNIKQVFFNEFLDSIGDSSMYTNISKLTNSLDVYYQIYQRELLEENESNERMRREEENRRLRNCNCVKPIFTMEEKMLRWKKACSKYQKKIRKKEVPPYFKSEFCIFTE